MDPLALGLSELRLVTGGKGGSGVSMGVIMIRPEGSTRCRRCIGTRCDATRLDGGLGVLWMVHLLKGQDGMGIGGSEM
jgi:hypothetical protein